VLLIARCSKSLTVIRILIQRRVNVNAFLGGRSMIFCLRTMAGPCIERSMELVSATSYPSSNSVVLTLKRNLVTRCVTVGTPLL
jgi:hypothetical protein